MSKNKTLYNQDFKKNGTPYTMVANQIFELYLRPSQLMTYMYLVSHGDMWTPGLRSIDQATGMNKTTVSKAIKKLIQLGLIKLIKNKIGKRDEYEIVPWSQILSILKTNPQAFTRKKNRKKATLRKSKAVASLGIIHTVPNVNSIHIQQEQKEQEYKIIQNDHHKINTSSRLQECLPEAFSISETVSVVVNPESKEGTAGVPKSQSPFKQARQGDENV